MANASKFVCQNCGFESGRWQGKCQECQQWNTLAEVAGITRKGARPLGGIKSVAKVVSLSAALASGNAAERFGRLKSGFREMDEVLGGGYVPGSLVLLGGDPGIGKSTLALQVAVRIASLGQKTLYISGEESVHQIGLRAGRVSKDMALDVLSETSLESVLDVLVSSRPKFAVVDSIQTMTSAEVNGIIGGVSQVSFATNSLMRLAKAENITLLVIGHVTKEGMLAGPKTLEHMVDTVLHLEGDKFSGLRFLRSNKNRFGSTGEVGVFAMHEQGLAEVSNPAEIFLEHRSGGAGTCMSAIMEGNKVLLVEIQALTSPLAFGFPRRAASGFDQARLQLLLAILEKKLQIKFSAQDVYINVAGGFELDERAADLPVCLAILSSYYNTALPKDFLAFGEVGLVGEVRGVPHLEKRLREAAKLGFHSVCTTPGKKMNITNRELSVQNIIDLSKFFKS